jgi:hypothetical protein
MRQAISAKPFTEIMAEVVPFEGCFPFYFLAHGDPVEVPAKRRSGPATVNSLAVRTLIGLSSGEISVRYFDRTDPALALSFLADDDRVDRLAFRTRAYQMYSTTKVQQPKESLALFATYLLLNKAPDFSAAYLALLAAAAIDQETDEDGNLLTAELDRIMATAADELDYACEADLGLAQNPGDLIWFYAIHPELDQVDELDDGKSGLRLDLLLEDPGNLRSYLAGEKDGPFIDLRIGKLPD